MPAVWGRLRAVPSSEVLQLPLNKRPRRDGIGEHGCDGPTPPQSGTENAEKAFWQSRFDSRLDALGITTRTTKGTSEGESESPYRYEILKGKTVPRHRDAEEISQLHRPTTIESSANSSPVFTAPPPRNPLRRLQTDPNWRPTSSVYDVEITAATPSAVPSPLQVSSAKMDPRALALQISPPSSPDIDSPVRKPGAEDVSPIDDELDMAQQEMVRGPRPPTQAQQHAAAPKAHASPPRSNIPTMRRDRRKQQEAALASRREPRSREGFAPAVQSVQPSDQAQGSIPRSDGMRWDRHGTPTHGPKTLSPPPPSELPMGSTTVISGPPRSPRNVHSPSFGDRVRQFGIGRAKPAPLDSRPAWNGASGRSALVQPVRDNTNVAPVQAPPRNANAKRVSRGRGGVPINGPMTTPGQAETSTSPATSASRMMPSSEPPKQQQTAQSGAFGASSADDTSGALSYPSPPHSGSPMRMSPETAQPMHSPTTTHTNDNEAAAQLPAPPMIIPDVSKAIKRKPPPAHFNQTHAAQNSLSNPSPPPEHLRPTLPGAAQDDDGWVQPPSRFSISTRATSYTGSPRPSGDEDQPPLPEPTPEQSSMMDRSRPRYAEEPENLTGKPIVISVKPFHTPARKDKTAIPRGSTGMEVPQRRHTGSIDVKDDRRASIMSTDKALPPAPPELLSAHDRVGNLNARLDSLAHRRNNINRSIKQMTELMPSDNLMASTEVLRKREIERMKVDGLRQELAEVQQEEYDLGLKLHRAYKRLERESEFEPTGLWVRRVTG
ncbi:hypothetical protein LIA77_01333 [Sarocladium implicatum]|nr:hypothetical protein LIA77_01333 [Sarocladium implicatum]